MPSALHGTPGDSEAIRIEAEVTHRSERTIKNGMVIEMARLSRCILANLPVGSRIIHFEVGIKIDVIGGGLQHEWRG